MLIILIGFVIGIIIGIIYREKNTSRLNNICGILIIGIVMAVLSTALELVLVPFELICLPKQKVNYQTYNIEKCDGKYIREIDKLFNDKCYECTYLDTENKVTKITSEDLYCDKDNPNYYVVKYQKKIDIPNWILFTFGSDYYVYEIHAPTLDLS